MEYTRKAVYTRRDPSYPDITIMLVKDSVNGYPTWDVYYRKDGYAYQYAFGLPAEKKPHSITLAFVTAMVNTANYLDMFEE